MSKRSASTERSGDGEAMAEKEGFEYELKWNDSEKG
jgi:hypothetical protein